MARASLPLHHIWQVLIPTTHITEVYPKKTSYTLSETVSGILDMQCGTCSGEMKFVTDDVNFVKEERSL
jgi:hypothetical protein